MGSNKIKKIAVFCGSSTGNSWEYSDAAIQLSDVIINAGITLVYGGGKVGLMGVIAEHILKRNGRIIGIIPKALVDAEIAHKDF